MRTKRFSCTERLLNLNHLNNRTQTRHHSPFWTGHTGVKLPSCFGVGVLGTTIKVQVRHVECPLTSLIRHTSTYLKRGKVSTVSTDVPRTQSGLVALMWPSTTIDPSDPSRGSGSLSEALRGSSGN